jgi:hypothetical protein
MIFLQEASITPRLIQTAPMAVGRNEEPIPVYLYCSEEGGWQTGVWLHAGFYDGLWRTQGWRRLDDYNVELRPTHWLPCSAHQSGGG